MKGTAIPIYEMFDGSKTKLQIPVYQRNYDWKVPNCQQLFDDLVDMVKEDRDTYFFGSIVEIGVQQQTSDYRWSTAVNYRISAYSGDG